jgi:hypothetical protein
LCAKPTCTQGGNADTDKSYNRLKNNSTGEMDEKFSN